MLAPEQLQHLQYDAANGEFGLRLADTMVEWGQKHISLLDAQGRSSFLQQVCCRSTEHLVEGLLSTRHATVMSPISWTSS